MQQNSKNFAEIFKETENERMNFLKSEQKNWQNRFQSKKIYEMTKQQKKNGKQNQERKLLQYDSNLTASN